MKKVIERHWCDKRDLDDLVFATMDAFDHRDWIMYATFFAPNAKFILPDHAGGESTVLNGVESFIAVLRGVLDGFDVVQHFVTNVRHEVRYSEATTRCYVIAEQFFGSEPGRNSISVGGRYEITSRRMPVGWRLTNLHFTPAWTRGNEGLFAQAAARHSATSGTQSNG